MTSQARQRPPNGDRASANPGMAANPLLMTRCWQDNTTPDCYTYRSQPKAVAVVERPKYRNNVPKPRGVHDYYNVMWDPHVYRGKSYQTYTENNDVSTASINRGSGASKNRRVGDGVNRGGSGGGDRRSGEGDRGSGKGNGRSLGEGSRREGEGNRPRQVSERQQQKSKRLGGITFPIPSPPNEGRSNFAGQTDQFLEELVTSVEEIEACTQTDAIHEHPVPETFIPAKFGLDVATQIEPCDLFDFNKEVCPIVENMTNKILEQSLLEVMEEEELEALRDQQRAYEELRRQELLRLQRLVEREAKIQEEQQRLMAKLKEQRFLESDTEDRVGAYLFSCNFLGELLPNALRSLREDGFLQNRTEICSDLVPWLNQAVTAEVKGADICKLLLDDMIRTVSVSHQREMADLYQRAAEARASNQFLSVAEPEYEGEGGV